MINDHQIDAKVLNKIENRLESWCDHHGFVTVDDQSKKYHKEFSGILYRSAVHPHFLRNAQGSEVNLVFAIAIVANNFQSLFYEVTSQKIVYFTNDGFPKLFTQIYLPYL